MARTKKGRGGRRAKPSVRPSASFARKVKQVITKNSETKTKVFSSNVTAYNQQLNTVGDCLRLMPVVAGGVGEDQRIGNMIKLKSLNLRGTFTFTLAQTTSANCRIGVRVLILKTKRYMDWNAGASDFGTNYNKLLEGVNTGVTGILSEFNTPINRDYFTVVADKRYYISQSVFAGTQGQAAVTNTTKFINMKIPYCRRNLQYDQDFNVSEPLNFPYYMLVSYYKLGGEAADAAGTSYLTFQYTTTASYTDP